METITEPEILTPLTKLRKDIKNAAASLSAGEARFLVDYYYIAQEDRKRSYNQERALGENAEPHAVVTWLAEQAEAIEGTLKAVLGRWAAAHPAGRWAQSICGIGPVISAGLLAHIDISKAPTVGHIWRFAGLDPTSVWAPKTKRPWNADLKTLVAFKLGECFVKVQNNEADFYGKLFVERKQFEIERNEKGYNVEACRQKLEKYNIGKNTDAQLWYAGMLSPADARALRELEPGKREGAAKKLARIERLDGLPMLPPAHIHARARRWTVKLFLAHFHEALWRAAHNNERPPKPYVLEHVGGHVHAIEMPDPEGVFAPGNFSPER